MLTLCSIDYWCLTSDNPRSVIYLIRLVEMGWVNLRIMLVAVAITLTSSACTTGYVWNTEKD